MITANLINSNATLNDFSPLDSIAFVPGENLTIAIQISDDQKGIRFIPPVAATLTMTFTDSDSNNFDKPGTKIDADDRSLWKVDLSQDETETLAGQNIIVTLDVNGDGTVIYKAFIANAIIRTNLSGDC